MGNGDMERLKLQINLSFYSRSRSSGLATLFCGHTAFSSLMALNGNWRTYYKRGVFPRGWFNLLISWSIVERRNKHVWIHKDRKEYRFMKSVEWWQNKHLNETVESRSHSDECGSLKGGSDMPDDEHGDYLPFRLIAKVP